MDTIGLYHSYLMYNTKVATSVSLEEFTAQLELEQQDIEKSELKYVEQLSGRDICTTDSGRILLARAIPIMVQQVDRIALKLSDKWPELSSFLLGLDAHEVAAIVILTALRTANSGQPHSYTQCVNRISKELHRQHGYRAFKAARPGHLRNILSELKSESQIHRVRVLNWYFNKFNTGCALSMNQMFELSSHLVYALVTYTGLIEIATFHSSVNLKFTPETERAILRKQLLSAHAKLTLSHMLIPPVPWTSMWNGGAILNGITGGSPFVRGNGSLLDLREGNTCVRHMGAANVLQETPWIINRYMLGIALQAEECGGVCGITPTLHTIRPPVKPWEGTGCDPSKEELTAWKREASYAYHADYVESSRRIGFNRRLRLAEDLSNKPRFFFVWSADFRGRLYPLQDWISPQADDLGKALLKFHESVPMTPLGLMALKVHAANEFGNDKGSYAERVAWVDSLGPRIQETIEHPLDNDWWMKADHPWMFLAALEELSRAKVGSPSNLPVYADGSCNGFQHLSALLRDKVCGTEVNLTSPHVSKPQEPCVLSTQVKPGDLYQRVSDAIEPAMQQQLPHWSQYTGRSLVKRNVMTSPYSVTHTGMAAQLMDYLRGVTELTQELKQECHTVATIVRTTRDTLLANAMGAMAWLKSVASATNKGNIPILWHTPVGFQVAQSYLRFKTKRIDLSTGPVRVQLQYRTEAVSLNKQKQTLSIAPNFIHSLDASHLVMTVEAACDEGIPALAMVHDSYGCHASHMPLLGAILREQFYRLHSTDILEEFRQTVLTLTQRKIPPVPPRGSLTLEDVLWSPHFFGNISIYRGDIPLGRQETPTPGSHDKPQDETGVCLSP